MIAPHPTELVDCTAPRSIGAVIRMVPAVIWYVAAIHALFVITFGPNTAFDAGNYLDMIINHHSNLVHAGGYPFVMGLFGLLGLDSVGKHFPHARLYFLIAIQHTLVVLALIPFCHVLRAIYGRIVADGAILLFGFHWGILGLTSLFYPEWMQVTFLILCVCLCWYGVNLKSDKKALVCFSLSGALFALSYLCKFNVLYFVLVPIGIIIVMPRSRTMRCANATCFVMSFFAVVWLFKVVPHRITTGTTVLSYDHAWVLLYRTRSILPDEDYRHLAEIGVNGKRLMVLNSLLPWDNKNVGGINNINWISPDIQRYRAKYLYILKAESDVLDKLIENLPPVQWSWFEAFSPTTYYLGLAEGDTLGVRVFLEAAWHYRWRYLKSIINGVVVTARGLAVEMMVPSQVDSSAGFVPKGFGFYSYQGPPTRAFFNPTNQYWVWRPGFVIFQALISGTQVLPTMVISFLFLVSFATSLVRSVRQSPMYSSRVTCIGSIVILGFIVFSEAILSFRWHKEMILVMPFICVTTMIGIVELSKGIKTLLGISSSYHD